MTRPDTSTLSRFVSARKTTEQLCSRLQAEDTVVQPIVDVSPPKWHLAHSTWFFENFILARHKPGYQLFHQRYNYLFNSYYESQGPRVLRSNRGNLTRPTTSEIMEYRRHVNGHIHELFSKSVDSQLLEWLELGIQHEMQHQELLVTDIKYILGNNPLFPQYAEEPQGFAQTSASPVNWLEVAEGVYQVGYKGNSFFFDNEKGGHKVYLHNFGIMDRLVNNAEYMEFMEDNGYGRVELWLQEGWDWVQQQQAQAPLYWFKVDGKWSHYTLAGFRKVRPWEPVTHVSYYEAEAFARWKGMRLPTEFEWEVACKQFEPKISLDANFLESRSYHPGISPQHPTQFFGDAWEWTSSAYLPYPGYSQATGALGEYNGKFMVNQMVLRGGSCATPTAQIRHSYRNFFHPDKQWQFSGIRLAQDRFQG